MTRPSSAVVFAAAAAAAMLALSSTASAERVPIVANVCDLAALGSTTAQGVAWSETHGIAVVDTGPDLIYFMDRDCSPTAIVELSSLGINSPTGITFHPPSGRFAITDAADDEVYFVEADGTLAGRCDLYSVGITSAQGIAFDPELGQFLVVDAGSDTAWFIDGGAGDGSPCGVHGSFALAPFGAASPEGVSVYTPGVYAVYDSGDARVYLVDAAGTLQDSFDLAGSTGTATSDVTYVRSLERWFVSSTSETLSEVDARGTSRLLCNTSGNLSSDPQDVAYRAASGELMYIDDVSDQLHVVDAATCVESRRVDLAAYGITEPVGLSFAVERDQFVIGDAHTDEITFIDYSSEQVVGFCNVRDIGVRIPAGVDYIEGRNQLVVVDQERDKIVVMDDTCKPLYVRSADFDDYSGAVSPTGLAFNRGNGLFLTIDDSTDRIYASNFEGLRTSEIDVGDLGLLEPTGIAAVPGMAGTYFVSDAGLDAIYVLDIPYYAEARGMSGYFEGGAAKVYLSDRGDGRLTGDVYFGGARFPVFGQFDAATGEIAFGAWPMGRSPLVMQGTVSADFEQLNLPAPAIPLTRTW